METPFDFIYRIAPLYQNRQLGQYNFNQDFHSWMSAHQAIIIENWWYYHGFHNLFLKRFEKENDVDFQKRITTATIENHIKPIVNLMTAHLYGSEIKRFVNRDDDLDKDLQKTLKQFVWNQNLIQELDDAKALNAIVTGYTVIQRRFLDLRTKRPFPIGSSIEEMKKYGYVKKEPLDSAFTHILPYIDSNGIIDPRRIGAIIYYADHPTYSPEITPDNVFRQSFSDSVVLEYIDDNRWVKYVKKTKNSNWEQITINPGTKWENKNQYEDVTIPFTVYKNVGDPFYVEGDSEVSDLRGLNLSLNELANGDEETIRYHQYPILGVFGGKLPDSFVRTKNTVVEFAETPQDKVDMRYIVWDGKLENSQNRQDQIRRSMSLVSGISLLSRGFMKDIGQIRSGPPLKALFTSDRAVMKRKFATFKSCEMEDMRADLTFIQKHIGIDLNIDNTVNFGCVFPEDFLGIDALLEAEINALKQQSGTEDIETILEVEHPDWSEEQIAEAVKNIQKAKETKANAGGLKVQSADKKELQQIAG